jgi:F0F1-type ATP synthase assembly protein I
MENAVVGRMPFWFLLFIASSGVFTVLSIPIDIFGLNFENGVKLNWAIVPSYLEQNFKPFVMLKYLALSPYGSVGVVILGLIAGAFMYILYDVYEWINGKIMRQRIKKILGFQSSKEEIEAKDAVAFADYLRKTKLEGYYDFIGSLKMLTDGLLYGGETFMFANLIRIVGLIIGLFFGLGTDFLLDSAEWFGISVLITVIFYALYLIYVRTNKIKVEALISDFKSQRAALEEAKN